MLHRHHGSHTFCRARKLDIHGRVPKAAHGSKTHERQPCPAVEKDDRHESAKGHATKTKTKSRNTAVRTLRRTRHTSRQVHAVQFCCREKAHTCKTFDSFCSFLLYWRSSFDALDIDRSNMSDSISSRYRVAARNLLIKITCRVTCCVTKGFPSIQTP